MTRSLLVITLLFCSVAYGVSFQRCKKPDGGIMYSNIPCECIQFADQNRSFNSKCTQIGMPTAAHAQQERSSIRKQKLDARNAEIRQIKYAIKRLEVNKKQIENKKQRVLNEMAHSFQNPGSETFGSIVKTRLSLVQKRLELVAINDELVTINNELVAKDRELDKFRSPEEVVLLEEKRAQARARAQQIRKEGAVKLRQIRQEQRSSDMEDKIDGIAKKLGVW